MNIILRRLVLASSDFLRSLAEHPTPKDSALRTRALAEAASPSVHPSLRIDDEQELYSLSPEQAERAREYWRLAFQGSRYLGDPVLPDQMRATDPPAF